MNAVVPFSPAALAVALKSTARAGSSGTANFLKMEKIGDWVFGIEGTEITEEDSLMVDPRAFIHGHVAWKEDAVGNKLGEAVAPITEPLPPTGPVPDGALSWQFQLGVGMVMEDGTPLMYTATSVGGKRAIGTLANEIAARVSDKACVPVVSLSSESYIHKKYGKIFNPVITIESWTTIAALEKAASEGKPAVPAAPAKAPAKKSTSKPLPSKRERK